MKSREQIDWPALRVRAAEIPEPAYDFVRDGLKYTVQTLHGKPGSPECPTSERCHVTGQQLCLGIKDLAIQRWGLLAITVLERWGIRRTEDFGTMIFAMIDRQELRASENDSIDDFKGVYEFDEAFGALRIG